VEQTGVLDVLLGNFGPCLHEPQHAIEVVDNPGVHGASEIHWLQDPGIVFASLLLLLESAYESREEGVQIVCFLDDSGGICWS